MDYRLEVLKSIELEKFKTKVKQKSEENGWLLSIRGKKVIKGKINEWGIDLIVFDWVFSELGLEEILTPNIIQGPTLNQSLGNFISCFVFGDWDIRKKINEIHELKVQKRAYSEEFLPPNFKDYDKDLKNLGEQNTLYDFVHNFREAMNLVRENIRKELSNTEIPLDLKEIQEKHKNAENQIIELFYKLSEELDSTQKEPETQPQKADKKGDDRMSNYIDFLKANYQIILYGAPGTGKTYMAKKLAQEFIKNQVRDLEVPNIEEYIEFVQFHPSYDYTDFVEGFRPSGVEESSGQLRFELRDGIFKNFCKKALDDLKQKKKKNDNPVPWVFIIDEINRAELSRVFGELMFAIEPGYRGIKGKVRTQYANAWDATRQYDEDAKGYFYIPENVFLIGTMNDIDRSVESIDFALRRRFAWLEIKVADVMDDVIKGIVEEIQDKNLKITENRISLVIEKAKALNNVISPNEGRRYGLNDHYHIGPALFKPLLEMLACEEDINECFERFWEIHLKPLINEYVRNYPNGQEFIENCKKTFCPASKDSTSDNQWEQQPPPDGMDENDN